MVEKSNSIAEAAKRSNNEMTSKNWDLVITRVFDAPRRLVFEAWTKPEHLERWWGPRGFTNTIHEMDVRPGGVWRFVMHGPDGVDQAALHRGRGKLAAPEAPESPDARIPPPVVLDAFCEAFNARDLDRLTGLLLDTASAEIVGINTEYGPEAAKKGSFWGAFQPLGWNDDLNCGIEPQLLQGYRPSPPRAEVRSHRGEPIVLFWYPQDNGEAVRDVARAEIAGDRLSRWRNYFFTPDVIAEICRELGVPFRTNGYRYWKATR